MLMGVSPMLINKQYIKYSIFKQKYTENKITYWSAGASIVIRSS